MRGQTTIKESIIRDVRKLIEIYHISSFDPYYRRKLRKIVRDICNLSGYDKPEVILRILHPDKRFYPVPKKVKKRKKRNGPISQWAWIGVGVEVNLGKYSRDKMQRTFPGPRQWGLKQQPVRRFRIFKDEKGYMILKRLR